MSGPCAKLTVRAVLCAPGGPTFRADNSVRRPQRTCPRVGEHYQRNGYALCAEICGGGEPEHAEARVLRQAGLWSVGATLWCSHSRICPSCARLIERARVATVITGRLPEHD